MLLVVAAFQEPKSKGDDLRLIEVLQRGIVARRRSGSLSVAVVTIQDCRRQ